MPTVLDFRSSTVSLLWSVIAQSLLLACFSSGGIARAQNMANVDQPMSTATFVNVYWDSNWDSDNPQLTREKIDAVTSAVFNSSYFGGLSEYGVTNLSFAGSVLPNKSCPQVAPNKVGFYDPINTSIAGFVQCEHDNESVLQASNMVYNVILPQSSIESDLFSSNFCNGPGANVAWHYHGLEKLSVIPWNVPFSDGPIYTIVQTNPSCVSPSSFFAALTHEMVEALTDPYPLDISIIPPHINIATENEIGDFCEPGKPNPNSGWPFVFTDPSGNSPLSPGVQVTTYWSNARQTCLNFSDATQPSISSAGIQLANFGLNLFLNIPGSGFGSSTPATSPLTINDNTDSWQAGNSIDQNAIHFSMLASTNSQVTVMGMTGLSGFPVTSADASLTIWTCNPNSFKCISAPFTTPANSTPMSFAIETSDGDFLTAINGGGIGAATDPTNTWPIHTDATTSGPWERFKIQSLAGSGNVLLQTNKQVVVPFFFPDFVAAVNGGGIGQAADPANAWPVHTDSSTIGPWARFSVIANQDGTFSFKTPDGAHFLTAVDGGGVGDPTGKLPLVTNVVIPIPSLGTFFTLVPLGFPLSVQTTQLNGGMVNSSYSTTISATGGTPRYTWSLQSGSLPPGLSLSSGGTISGTETKAGTFNFTVQVQDSTTPTPATATQSFTTTFSVPPPPCPSGQVQMYCSNGRRPIKMCLPTGSQCPTPTCGPGEVLVDGQCVPKGGYPR